MFAPTLALPLLLPLLVLLATRPTPSLATATVCTWKDGGAGRNSPHHAQYSYYCDAGPKEIDPGHVVYECYGMHVADWYASDGALKFASPCAPDIGYSPDCENRFWAGCIGNAQPHHNKHTFECFYMEGRDSCQWPWGFTPKTRPQSVQIWHKKG